MHLSWKLRAFALGALVVTACQAPIGSPGGPGSAGEPQVNYTGFNLVVVTDTSQSMENNDKQGFNREGAQLAVALANVSDNLALVPFNDNVGKVLPLQAMSSADRRLRFSKAIDNLENARATDYLRAMDATKEVLEAPGISNRSAIIFLSDGEHDPGLFHQGDVEEEKRLVREHASRFGDAEQSIYAIAFTDEAVSKLMNDMALNSGGAYYRVDEANELLDAYLEILGDVYELFEYTRDAKELVIEPIIRRLVYVLIKEDPDASLDRLIERDGNRVDLETALYRRPPSDEAAFDVVQFGGSLAGEWTCDARPEEGRVVALCQVPISFRIVPGAPRAEYAIGEQQTFQLEAICSDEELAEYAVNMIRVESQLSAGGKQGSVIPMNGRRDGPRKVIFTGKSRASFLGTSPSAGGTEEQDVEFRITLGGGEWTHTKHAATRVTAERAPEPDPEPEPEEALTFEWDGKTADGVLHLGEYWLGEVAFERGFEVWNRSENRVRVEFSTSGLVEPPAPIEVAAGSSQRVTLAFRGSQPPPGRRTSQLVCKSRPLSGQADLLDQVVDMDLMIYDLDVRVPGTAAVAPGGQTKLNVSAKVRPTGTSVDLTKDETEVPVGLTVEGWPARFGEGGFELVAKADAVTAGGAYQATFRAKPVGTQLAPKEYAIEVRVGGSKPTLNVSPERLSLELDLTDWASESGEDEWRTFDDQVEVTLTHHAELKLLTDLENLRGEGGQSIRQHDLIAAPVGSGSLVPGSAQGVEVRINLNDNLAAGTYQGNLTVAVRTPEGELVRVLVPVVVEVKR